jgi:HEAT repeat protein
MSNDGGVTRRQTEKLAELPIAERRNRLDELSDLLEEENPHVRQHAMNLIAEVAAVYPAEVSEIMDTVAQQLSDEMLDDDAAAVVATVAAATPTAVTERLPLLVAVIDEGGDVTQFVTTALVAISESNAETLTQPGIIEQLRGLLDADTPTVRANATQVLGDIADVNPDAVDTVGEDLQARLDDETLSVQRSATYALAQLADANPEVAIEASEQLCTLTGHEDSAIRAGAMAALAAGATTSSEEPIEVLLDQLWAETPAVRAQAAFVLAELADSDPELLEPHARQLTRGLADENARVRGNLLSALSTLEESFPDTVAAARTQVGDALATVSPDDETAEIPTAQLRELAGDKRVPTELRRAARDALYGGDADSETRNCPNCGEAFSPDATFCSVCGTSLE